MVDERNVLQQYSAWKGTRVIRENWFGKARIYSERNISWTTLGVWQYSNVLIEIDIHRHVRMSAGNQRGGGGFRGLSPFTHVAPGEFPRD